MTRDEKAEAFAALHQPGAPVILYNIWDPGSAKAVAGAGAKAIATGSWSVAAAQGFDDGEDMPLSIVLKMAARIARSVDLPVTLDFEGAYAVEPDGVAANVAKVVEAGCVGINFEDQVVGGAGLHSVEVQTARIAAARRGAGDAPFYINARTDVFLKEKDASAHAALLPTALERAKAYREAGASGFFVPGLIDSDLIGAICEGAGLPVNVMMKAKAPDAATLAAKGVARISHGPGPYVEAMAALAERFKAL